MRYFFIDLENVRNEGLEGVLSLNEKDMVYIFYSENAFSMAIPTMESITNSRCSSKFIKTNYIGKNAMDFQIVSLFGAMIERCREGSFYIISKDNGFRSAVSFCESFFSEYPIKCGVYPRIITAIAAESREAGKEISSEGTKEKKSRSRRSRKRSGKREQSDVQNIVTDDRSAVANEEPEPVMIENENAGIIENTDNSTAETTETDKSVPADNIPAEKTKRSRRRNRSSKKAEVQPAVADAAPETPDETESGDAGTVTADAGTKSGQESGAHGRLEYIYKLLGEYLSEKTIEIYAGYIDDGISKTNNRDELQTYFRENLGDDEGEALFKVVKSDYDKYKQSRPKKSSHARHRRSGRGGKNKEKEA